MGKVTYLFNNKGEKEMFSVFDIANYFLSKEPMTNKKLQKLCYYTQAWYLALNNERLFNSNFEAWIHGPVCPELYHNFKNYGYNEIPQLNIMPENLQHDQYILSFLEQIYKLYGSLNGNQLEELSHSEYPWKNARGNIGSWKSCNNIIDNEDMRYYYYKKYCQED